MTFSEGEGKGKGIEWAMRTYSFLSLLRIMHEDNRAKSEERGAREGEFCCAGHVDCT